MIRRRFWRYFYGTFNEEPPTIVLVVIQALVFIAKPRHFETEGLKVVPRWILKWRYALTTMQPQ